MKERDGLPEPGDRFREPRALRGTAALGGRTPRDAIVLAVVTGDAAVVRKWLGPVAAAANDIEDWYARLVLVLGDGGAADAAGDSRRVVIDENGAVRAALGLERGESAVIIADRFRQVYHSARVDSPDALPGPDDIEQWTRFLATQCPECGVIDEPGRGEWTQ